MKKAYHWCLGLLIISLAIAAIALFDILNFPLIIHQWLSVVIVVLLFFTVFFYIRVKKRR